MAWCMRRGGLASAIVLASTLASLRADAAPRTISGIVATTAGDPIPAAKILVVDAKGRVLGNAVTDSKGAWRLTVDQEGRGQLRARVRVEGMPDVSTSIEPDDLVVKTTLVPGEIDSIDVEVKGDKKPLLEPPPPEEPTKYAVDGQLMTKLPGTRGDPFAALTSLPSLGRPPALSTVYIVRGAGPEESVTYVDGAPLPHAFHFGGLVAVLPPAFIESIGIMPGGFGVPYGRATAGVIDVKLGSAKSDSIHGSVVLDAIDVGAYLSAPITSSTRLAVGARRSHVDAWIGSLLGDRVAGDLPRYLDGQAILEQDFGSRVRARVGFIAASDSVNVTDPNAPTDKPRSGSWTSSVVRLHARMDAGIGESGSVLSVFSIARSTDTIIGELDQWEDARKTFFGRWEASGEVGPKKGDARFAFGFDVLGTHIDGKRVLTLPTSAFGGSSTFAMRGAIAVERIEPAVYAQLVLKPAAELTITPGVRLDRAPFGELSWQPRLAVRADVTSSTAFKATAGLYSRPNVMDAVNARDYAGTFLPVAVEAGPVHGAQVGAGVEQAFGSSVQVFLDFYARSATNVLVPFEQPARPIYGASLGSGKPVLEGYEYPLYSETGRSRAVGTELLLKFKAEDVIGFVGYALGRAEVRDGPYSAWRRAPLDQTHVLNAAVIFQLGSGWELGGRFRLAIGVQDSPYPATDIAPKSDPNIDPNRPLPTLAPLHSLDVRLEKSFRIAQRGSIAAYVEVRNIYDRRAREPLAYNYVYGYPVVGSGLPIIPNIGVRGSF